MCFVMTFVLFLAMIFLAVPSTFAAPNASQAALNKGIFEQSSHQYSEARNSYSEALQQATNTTEKITALKGLGMLAMGDGRDEDALLAFKQASELETTLPNVTDMTRATTLMNLGLAYTHLYQYGQAEPIYRKAVEAAESSNNKQTIANAYDHLGVFYTKQGRFDNADEASLKAVELAKTAWGAESVNAACMMANRGYLLGLQGRYKEAEADLKDALEIQRAKCGDDSGNVSAVLSDLGKVYLTQGKLSSAEAAFAEAIKIRSKTCGKNDLGLLAMQDFLSRTYMEEGKIGAAKQIAETTLKLAEQRFGEASHKIFGQLLSLASVLEKSGDYSRALSLANRAYAINRSNHKLLLLLSKLYQSRDPNKSEIFAREALKQCESQFGAQHPEVARCSLQLSSVLKIEKRSKEAAELDARAKAIQQRIVRLNSGK